jgi:hypothetical protein
MTVKKTLSEFMRELAMKSVAKRLKGKTNKEISEEMKKVRSFRKD